MTDVSSEGSQAADDQPSESDLESSSQPKTAVTRIRILRIWPVALQLICLWGLRIVPGLYGEMPMPVIMAGFMGPLVCAGLIVLWWLFLSRASLQEKVLGLLRLLAILATTSVLADKTIQGFGIMIYAVPWGISGFAVALIGLARVPSFSRTWFALLASLVCCGFWDMVRTDEIRGNFHASRSWRWEPTAEERFLQKLTSRQPKRSPDATASHPLADAEWPAFRGPDRNSVRAGIVLGEDWQAQPPKEN